MNTTAAYPLPRRANWLRRTEAWLDAKGRAAWIAAMVLGFIVFWPLGLALLAYMIWGKKMFASSCRKGRDHAHRHDTAWGAGWGRGDHVAFRSSGNAAFDSYKADTLKRLEEEQDAFEAFLQRLRQAKDKSEFDTFMEDRARRNREAEVIDATAATPPAAEEGPRKGEY